MTDKQQLSAEARIELDALGAGKARYPAFILPIKPRVASELVDHFSGDDLGLALSAGLQGLNHFEQAGKTTLRRKVH